MTAAIKIVGACVIEPKLAGRVPAEAMARLKPFSRAVILAMRHTNNPHVLLDALALAGFDRSKAEKWLCRAVDAIPDPLPSWEPKTVPELKRWCADPGGPEVEAVFAQAIESLQ